MTCCDPVRVNAARPAGVSPRSSSLARPKSAIFTRPFLSSRMFSGLISRWTIPSSWAYCSASQICGTMASACARLELAAGDHLPQVQAVDELHEEVVQAACLAEVVQRDDVRVIQARESPRFAGESLGEGGVRADLGRENLERDQTVEPPLACLVNGSHSAVAKQFQDFEVWEVGGELARIGWDEPAGGRVGRSRPWP